jgi:hypothetical protein
MGFKERATEGVVDDDQDRLRSKMTIVHDRSQETLLPIILANVCMNCSIIMSDGWASYNNLGTF